MMAKPTVAATVAEHIDELKTLDRQGLYLWAETHGMGNHSAIPRFKQVLLERGIDYANLPKPDPPPPVPTHELPL
jgi:hypothetical protein